MICCHLSESSQKTKFSVFFHYPRISPNSRPLVCFVHHMTVIILEWLKRTSYETLDSCTFPALAASQCSLTLRMTLPPTPLSDYLSSCSLISRIYLVVKFLVDFLEYALDIFPVLTLICLLLLYNVSANSINNTITLDIS